MCPYSDVGLPLKGEKNKKQERVQGGYTGEKVHKDKVELSTKCKQRCIRRGQGSRGKEYLRGGGYNSHKR